MAAQNDVLTREGMETLLGELIPQIQARVKQEVEFKAAGLVTRRYLKSAELFGDEVEEDDFTIDVQEHYENNGGSVVDIFFREPIRELDEIEFVLSTNDFIGISIGPEEGEAIELPDEGSLGIIVTIPKRARKKVSVYDDTEGDYVEREFGLMYIQFQGLLQMFNIDYSVPEDVTMIAYLAENMVHKAPVEWIDDQHVRLDLGVPVGVPWPWWSEIILKGARVLLGTAFLEVFLNPKEYEIPIGKLDWMLKTEVQPEREEEPEE